MAGREKESEASKRGQGRRKGLPPCLLACPLANSPLEGRWGCPVGFLIIVTSNVEVYPLPSSDGNRLKDRRAWLSPVAAAYATRGLSVRKAAAKQTAWLSLSLRAAILPSDWLGKPWCVSAAMWIEGGEGMAASQAGASSTALAAAACEAAAAAWSLLHAMPAPSPPLPRGSSRSSVPGERLQKEKEKRNSVNVKCQSDRNFNFREESERFCFKWLFDARYR